MGQAVKFKRKTTEEIDDLEIEDGSLIYNIENGKTYMDYGTLRIPTGGGSNGGVYVGEEEPTDPDVTLWVDTPISETKASEIVDEYTESNKVGYSCDYINGIIDSGSNTNGNYIKYADGTMICYREITTTISCNTSWGSLYYGVDNTVYSFAQEFVSTPTVLTDIQSTTATGLLDAKYNPLSVSTTSVSNFSIVRPTTNASVSVRIVILAIGKWK